MWSDLWLHIEVGGVLVIVQCSVQLTLILPEIIKEMCCDNGQPLL